MRMKINRRYVDRRASFEKNHLQLLAESWREKETAFIFSRVKRFLIEW